MIKITFDEKIPVGYVNLLNTPGIPLVILIDRFITCTISGIFDKDYCGHIEQKYKDDFLEFPVLLVGGNILAKFHAIVDINVLDDGIYAINNLAYFSIVDGWMDMIKEGRFEFPSPEPDPDWLLGN